MIQNFFFHFCFCFRVWCFWCFCLFGGGASGCSIFYYFFIFYFSLFDKFGGYFTHSVVMLLMMLGSYCMESLASFRNRIVLYGSISSKSSFKLCLVLWDINMREDNCWMICRNLPKNLQTAEHKNCVEKITEKPYRQQLMYENNATHWVVHLRYKY